MLCATTCEANDKASIGLAAAVLSMILFIDAAKAAQQALAHHPALPCIF
jgi:hypothetical protein